MSEFGISNSSYFDAPDVVLEHARFPHLTGAEWDALNRLATISIEAHISPMMNSATPNEKLFSYTNASFSSSPNLIGDF